MGDDLLNRCAVFLDDEEHGDLLQRAATVHAENVRELYLPPAQKYVHLQELTILCNPSQRDQCQVMHLELLNLRKLKLEGFFFVPATAAPMSRLTDVDITVRTIGSPDVVSFLSAAHKLEVLFLNIRNLTEFSPDSDVLESIGASIPLLLLRVFVLCLPHEDFRRFVDLLSLPDSSSGQCEFTLMPYWQPGERPLEAVLGAFPTSAITLPLSRGTATELDLIYNNTFSDYFHVSCHNYVKDQDGNFTPHSVLTVVLGERKDWTTPEIVQACDALLLHPETGTNTQVRLFTVDQCLLTPFEFEEPVLPHGMLRTRFPNLKYLDYVGGRSESLEELAEILLQIAPAPSPAPDSDPAVPDLGVCGVRPLGFHQQNRARVTSELQTECKLNNRLQSIP